MPAGSYAISKDYRGCKEASAGMKCHQVESITAASFIGLKSARHDAQNVLKLTFGIYGFVPLGDF